MPEAGMFIMADIRPTGLTGDRFAENLLAQEHVAVMPGRSFGKEAEGFVRLSLTVPDESLAEASERIRRFAQTAGA